MNASIEAALAPRVTVEELQRLTRAQLSKAARYGYVALLLGGLGQSVALGSLWLTEPALKPHTSIALALMSAIGLAWAAFAVWVLTRRRPLLARDGVVAGRMAVAFTNLFVAGSLLIGIVKGGAAPLAAAATGAVMLAAAIVMLARARRRHAALLARREFLEREIAGGGK